MNVSIIIPVYNGENYLERFLDSLLKQTYVDVQIIIVNDGSTDRSVEIINDKKEKIEKKFEELIILNCENGGAAYAVNIALKYVKGKYLTWADCDDVLHPTNIEKKVMFLENNPEYGLVNCGAQAIDFETNKFLWKLKIEDDYKKENMFEQIIEGIPCYPGVFMIKSQALFKRIQNREIYFNREAGQNYQLLLPVAYYEKCGFIDEILYDYYIRKDSHSRKIDYEKYMNRTYINEKLLDKVLEFIPIEEKKKVMNKIKIKNEKNRFYYSYVHNKVRDNDISFKKLKEYKANTYRDRIKNISMHSCIFKRAIEICRKVI